MDSEERDDCSVTILRGSTTMRISTLLNPVKLIPNENKLPRDWRGLAELCGLPGEIIPGISQERDPTERVLKLWTRNCKTEATINKLIGFLEQLDRTDVVDDVQSLVAEDVKMHKEQPECKLAVNLDNDQDILTTDDLHRLREGQNPQHYHAFVLFDNADIDFATDLITKLEKDYDLKLCVKERDLVGGSYEHDAVIKLIAERCDRLIVIFSKAFIENNTNQFFYSLAQAISVEKNVRKIIPCVYEDCGELPIGMRWYTKLDYRRSGQYWNFWEMLRNSILTSDARPVNGKLSLPENRSLTSSNSEATLSEDNSISHGTNSRVTFITNDLPNGQTVDDHETTNLEVQPNKINGVAYKASFFKKFKPKSWIFKSKSDNALNKDARETENKNERIKNKENKTKTFKRKTPVPAT
ncbi:hypothetical protein ABEB36_011907 [Hypothenemus hampei]|uniref:Myeloid differentiation primary response protein MyD88 n=1 Tax=Hypothenemus hampei TaxID=57062 RepID=A0ABD1E9E7_HYPHA